MEKEELTNNLKETSTWLRLLYMLLFVLIYTVAKLVVAAVVVFQFFAVLLTKQPNAKLLVFGDRLACFIYEILRFLTFNTEDKPYPFGAWPEGTPATKPKPKRVTTRKTSTQTKK